LSTALVNAGRNLSLIDPARNALDRHAHLTGHAVHCRCHARHTGVAEIGIFQQDCGIVPPNSSVML
jgi:hypothetical protein